MTSSAEGPAPDPAVDVLLFTGKGGVGKTTVSAATALRAADEGRRTIVLSTDPAHSLADSFGVELGSEPTEVAPKLWAQQLDARQRMEESWDELRSYFVEVLNWAGADDIEAEELAVLPGVEDLFSLGDIRAFADDPRWDLVVVDCAPTADTLRLLSLPEVLAWYMDRAFPLGRRVSRLVGPILKRVTDVPVADDEVFGAGQRFYERLDGVRELLADPARTTIRLVVNPEKMVIAEARRTHTYLSLYGYGVDAVIVNRVLPDEVADPWFDQWKAAQSEHLRVIDESFSPVAVLRGELASSELVGLEGLRGFGYELYGEADPARPLGSGRPMTIERAAGGYVLRLALPFVGSGEVDVGRSDDELLLTLGPHRRAVILPDSLRRRSIVGASLRDGFLTVHFEDPRT